MGFADINYLAVGLAAVLSFVLGMLWYSPVLFGKAWMAGQGYTEADLKRMQRGMGPTYVLSFVCWFLMATILAVIAGHFGEGVGPTFHIGLHLWLGFSATVGLTNNRFSDKPLGLWAIDGGYQVASIGVMAVVLGLWR